MSRSQHSRFQIKELPRSAESRLQGELSGPRTVFAPAKRFLPRSFLLPEDRGRPELDGFLRPSWCINLAPE